MHQNYRETTPGIWINQCYSPKDPGRGDSIRFGQEVLNAIEWNVCTDVDGNRILQLFNYWDTEFPEYPESKQE